MLDFQFDDIFWVAKATLPSWAGYQNRKSMHGVDVSDGSASITFAPEGRDESPLTPAELASVQWLLDSEAKQAAAVVNGVWAAYPRLQEAYGYVGADRDAFMPNLKSPADFRDLIGLLNVNIHPLMKDGLPYIGYEFSCAWDEEHGLGVLMHGTRVVDIGGADTAILLWIAERDAR